ncbi:MAG TPA: 23S rRNA (uracil(1939)-C(5))-methyltransferase RlmD [Thermodesulfobacteriota bacterium]|nr:23S rRNA (uracil(1939)-C(5))-methyltransferase RlmD [Thermodesulfobacteriota bacterium]
MVEKVYVRIESVAFKGYGVARAYGKVVFVPYSATGDRGWIEILEEKKNYSVGRFAQIVEPSPWRVNTPCPYFGSCGGCQWQHIDYSFHGELKKEILKESLKRLGSLKEIPLISVAPSHQFYDYRIRVQLKVKGKSMGYYQEGSHRIVKIDHCPISHPLVNQIIQTLWEERIPALPIEEIEINVSPMEGRGTLLFYPLSFDQRMEDFLKHFLQTHPILRGIAIARKDRLRLFGDPHLNFTIPWGQGEEKRNLKFRISSGSFSQVNLEQNQRLVQTVLQFSEGNKGERVFDLYAGAGNLTLPLALGAKEVLGIEENKMAVGDGRFNAERNGIKNVRLIQGKVEDVLKNLTRKPDLIVLDPPRTGCKTILDQVVRLKPQKIIYVSCEPTTLSRDLRLFLDRGYSLQRLSLIDMFPQTYHMEVIGLLQQDYHSG